MDMTPDIRNYVRSLNAGRLSSLEVAFLIDLMLQLDPTCGPVPPTDNGKLVAAQVYVRLMQGESVQSATWHPHTWRAGHAR